jgi:SAM-dependent methyltransferase
MDAPRIADTPRAADAEAIRLQAEEHPLITDTRPASPAEHTLRLMHLRAYDEAVAHAAGCDVLDVGCNTGYGTVRFVPVARRVVGVDVSPAAIEAARERASGGRPEFLLTGGDGLPFPVETFDLVTSFQVLEHVPDALAYLRELARVARPRGTVILATPNAAIRLDPGMTPWNRFHLHEYRAAELHALLGEVFADVRILGMFGAPLLYETEVRRVDAARQRIRRKTEAAVREAATTVSAPSRTVAGSPRAARPLSIRIARRLVPAPARAWLRSLSASPTRAGARSKSTAPAADIGAATHAAPSPDLEAFLGFSVGDLYYADADLDRSMDLLAICRLGSSPAIG